MSKLTRMVDSLSLRFTKNPKIRRRGGIISSYKLEKVFKDISKDQWVIKTRKGYANPTKKGSDE